MLDNFENHETARRSKTVSNFAKRILAILDNIVMLVQREFEAKQQLRQQMRRKIPTKPRHFLSAGRTKQKWTSHS